jgi:glucan phosphoethanolaminetransferase (alkaline phosphatase superfamily)
MWHWRWWLIAISGLLLFLVMNTATITNESGIITETDRQVRLNFAIFFALLAAQLVAWMIGMLHTLINHRSRWLVAILVLPPVAFVYMFYKNEERDY